MLGVVSELAVNIGSSVFPLKSVLVPNDGLYALFPSLPEFILLF